LCHVEAALRRQFCEDRKTEDEQPLMNTDERGLKTENGKGKMENGAAK
jgi:hypothetical protein